MQFWVNAFDLPSCVELTTTPCPAATERSPVIRNSRAATTTTTQDGSSDCEARITRHGDDHELVREGIEELAQLGHEVAAPGDPPVERVGRRGGDICAALIW